MPYQVKCSKCWIRLVSYVLATTEVGQTFGEQWTYMPQCIQGFTAAADNSLADSKHDRETTIDSNEASTNGVVNTKTRVTRTKEIKR
jgi:hypothetical protein